MIDYSQKNIWLNIDKPYGYSSAKVVAIVKRLTKAKRVGHAGTLDPLATGVLPIAVNKATKTCQYITNIDKKYYFEIAWGEFRDTDDFEGEVIKSSDERPETTKIITALANFIGKIEQMPPQYSAIKINGRKAYEMARNNEVAPLKLRKVEVYDIKLIFNDDICAKFEINCSKGTYVRSFARELSQRLGVCGYISSLRRLKVGDFSTKNAISLDKLKNMITLPASDDLSLRLRDVLNFMLEVELSDFDALKVQNGQVIRFDQNILQSKEKIIDDQVLVKIINNNEVFGLGRYYQDTQSGSTLEEFTLKPINIFNQI